MIEEREAEYLIYGSRGKPVERPEPEADGEGNSPDSAETEA